MGQFEAKLHGGHIHCVDPCALTRCTCTAPITGEDFFFFIHPKLSTDEIKEIHDDTLSKLTDDLNNLVRQASEKRKDRTIGFLTAPNALIPVWTDPNEHPEDAQTEKLDTNEKVMKFLGLKQ